MPDLASLQADVVERLSAKHAAREALLTAGRDAIRASANAIRAVHRRDAATADGLLAEAAARLETGRQAAAGQPEIEFSGLLSDAQKEYAEGRLTYAMILGGDIPGPQDLGVSDAAWLNGLAETVGEMRRHLLDVLRAGDLQRAEELLAGMDDIHTLLVTIDFPEGITGGLRRSTDVARAIIERTRGDLTTALVQSRLQTALEGHRRDVLGG